MEYISQLEIQLKNNQQSVYDIAQIFSDYSEMCGKSDAFRKYTNKKYGLGLDAEIPTRWSKFQKSIKDKYLKVKKVLAS